MGSSRACRRMKNYMQRNWTGNISLVVLIAYLAIAAHCQADLPACEARKAYH